MQKRVTTGATEAETDKVTFNKVVTKLGSLRQITGRTWQGDKDDGSETKDNDKYQT
jgi:hypothetical protein